MKRLFLLFILQLVLLVFIQDTIAAPSSPVTVRIAAFNLYPTIFQAKDGSVQGFYVDFLKEIASREGWDIEYVYGNWADGLARIKSGEVDVITNVAFNMERAAFMDYGKVPLLTVWSELYVPVGSAIESIREVKGKKIGVMKGDFNGNNFVNLVEKLEIPCEIVEYGNFEEVFKAIFSKQVDGGVVNNTFGAAKQNEYNIRSSGVVFNPFDIFFTVAKSQNQQILATLDKYLEEWRQEKNSPFHEARERWSHGTASTIHVVPPAVKRTLFIFILLITAAIVFLALLRIQVRRKTKELNEQLAERRKMEETLIEKDEHLRFFFEYAPASLAMFDRNMRYIYASNRWRSDYGLTEISLAGLSHYEVFSDIPEHWKEAHRRGLAGEILREEAEQFVRADGSVLWLRWEIRPWYDIEGKVGGVLIFTEDITEKRMVEDALGASERFLRTMTDNLPGMVAYWTSELRCKFANKTYLEWFGRTIEQMIGITIQELMGEDLFKKNEYYINGVLQGKPQHFERTLIKPTGETGNTWAQYIPDVVGGTVQGFYVLISDVTELKHAEEEKGKLEVQLQQAQKMESVGRLAGGVAHDFNNLLTVILGYTQLSIMELDPAHPVYSHLEGIRKAADRSADLTHQLLAFARKQTIAPKVLDLNVTVEHILKMLRRLIGEAINLVWQPANELWQVKIDPSQIDQILANLCVNARDAIGDVGKITIETGHSTFDKEYCATHFGFIPGEFVLLAVSDDGCGMDKETMSHIFEPFFTTKGIGEGTGLGLAMVYGIVKQNNGFINIYSEPGHGTTFKIYLPRHEGTASQIPVEGAAKPLSRGQESILLVEDEVNILNITTVLLEKLGYKVFPAKTPGEATDLARQHADKIDMLMTDVVMPEMNGRDLSKNLLQICPKIKCLYMSGYTANVIAHHGVLDENIHFISKPFSLPALATKVRDVLDKSSNGTQDSFE